MFHAGYENCASVWSFSCASMEEDDTNIPDGDFTRSENEILHQDHWVAPPWPYADTSHVNTPVINRDKHHWSEYCTSYHSIETNTFIEQRGLRLRDAFGLMWSTVFFQRGKWLQEGEVTAFCNPGITEGSTEWSPKCKLFRWCHWPPWKSTERSADRIN